MVTSLLYQAVKGAGGGHGLAKAAAWGGVSALIGGTTSFLTGGSFVRGAAAGAVGGLLGHKAYNNRGAFGAHFGGVGKSLGIKIPEKAAAAFSVAKLNRRSAMYAGAGLFGAIFGGDRRSHARGFNANRGSRI